MLRSFGSCLRLFPRLHVTSILPFIFPSVTWFWRQFLRKMCPIQLAFLLFIVRRIFLSSLALCNASSFLKRSVQLISIPLQHHISKLPRYFWSTFRRVQVSAPCKAILHGQHSPIFFLKSESDMLVETNFYLLNAALAMAILNLISRVPLASFVIMLPK